MGSQRNNQSKSTAASEVSQRQADTRAEMIEVAIGASKITG